VENRELVVGVVKKKVAANNGPRSTEAAVKRRESREAGDSAADTFQVSQNTSPSRYGNMCWNIPGKTFVCDDSKMLCRSFIRHNYLPV
jgi:hypothetical protein